MAPRRPIIKPGETVRDSGIYQSSETGQKTTLGKGDTAPPTPHKGETWKQIVNTNVEKKR